MCHFNSTCINYVLYQLIADVGRSDFYARVRIETGLSRGVVCHGNSMKANRIFYTNIILCIEKSANLTCSLINVPIRHFRNLLTPIKFGNLTYY